MAVFTAIGAAVATGLGLTGTFATIAGVGLSFAGTLVAGVVAGGLAYATAKLTGAFDVPGLGDVAGNRGQGSKVQVAPSTDNKIGIAYGKNFLSGPITDINISNKNQTMHFCIVLSEYVDGATYTVGDIFKNAGTCTFTGNELTSITEQDGSVNTDLAGDIRVGVYAGSTDTANVIFPTSGTGSALPATNYMPHWISTAAYTMQGLVFAMVEIDYDAENGLTGLPPMTFELNNSISNPGDVLIDYLNNERYGAGLSNTLIDVSTITGTANTAMKGYSAEQVTYTPNTGGSATQDRWQINGFISTFNDVSDNIARICQAAATFFLFDTKTGKFKVIPNRPTASTFSLTDDNIVSRLKVSSTELYSLFNKAEVEYADKNRRDQTNIIFVETPAGDRNPNEPDNAITMRMDLINDNIRAEALANLDLSQSRKGMVIQCETDFSGMQIDVGDVVDLTNSDFGFTSKEFRVIRHEEIISDQGMVTCGLTLLEYDANVYVTSTQTETSAENFSNVAITPFNPITIPPPIQLSNLIKEVDTFTVSPSGGSGAKFTVFKDPSTATYTFVTPTTAGSGYSVGDTITVDGKHLRGQTATHNLSFTVDTINGSGGVLDPVGNISGNANIFDGEVFGGFQTREGLGNLSVGSQIEDKPANKENLSNAQTLQDLFTTRELDFTAGTGLEAGDYSFTSGIKPLGQLSAPTANYSIQANVNITYANGTNQNEQFGTDSLNFDYIPTVIEANKKITIANGAVSGNVVIQGFNTLNPTPANIIGFGDMRYDMVKINKGDVF